MGERPFVAGVDSSTQSCKVVVWDPVSGEVVREGRAPHPEGTEVDPRAWWDALNEAVAAAGGLDDVRALSVGGQQHGMVVLDERGEVIRPALLWNDTRSAGAARDLIAERAGESSGEAWWADATGSVPVGCLGDGVRGSVGVGVSARHSRPGAALQRGAGREHRAAADRGTVRGRGARGRGARLG